MKVCISGSSGLIGTALVAALTDRGHAIFRLGRSKPVPEGMDAVIHLAGESILGRWTRSKKQKIRESRLKGTQMLAESLLGLSRPPEVLVCASAIGFYGNRGDELLTEESPSGADFLAKVCREWEKAAEPARHKGIRVVHLRFGIVLSAQGGALKKMLLPFKLGLGGRLGSGRQWMSWVAIDDVVGAVLHAIHHRDLSQAVNTTAPQPATNLEFTKALGKVLSRPTVFPVPAFAVRLLMGEMGEALLLSSARVRPSKLMATGYDFRFPELEGALTHLLS